MRDLSQVYFEFFVCVADPIFFPGKRRYASRGRNCVHRLICDLSSTVRMTDQELQDSQKSSSLRVFWD